MSRRVERAWRWAMVVLGTALLALTVSDLSLGRTLLEPPLGALVLVPLAFLAEYVDSSLGMGYGTTLTPLLLLLGLDAGSIVPAILFSELVTGLAAGGMHHRVGNVRFGRDGRPLRIVAVLATCSVAGTVAAVAVAVTLPERWIKLYIGLMVMGIGLFILLSRRGGRFTWGKMVGLGSLAAFNKALSGGGYGPLVTGGQVVVGVPEKEAVGITSLAEALVCFVALALYLAIDGGLVWSLALALALGGLLSVPLAAWTVRWAPPELVRRTIGYATAYLGLLSLVKLVL